MERPERYDPEDLEHLMLEHGFDELLEEERAYALRHLTDRAEYERMRALLLHVHEARDEADVPGAGPAVRERVLRAYREQQRPHWRIWLNSLGGSLIPEWPMALKGPALALGTVAVVVFLGLWVRHEMDVRPVNTLAEVKHGALDTLRPPSDETDRPPTEHAIPEAPIPRPASVDTGIEREVTPEVEPSTGNINVSTSPATAQISAHVEADHASYTADKQEVMETTAAAYEDALVHPAPVRLSSAAARDTKTAKTASAMDTDANGAPAPSEDALLGLLRAAW